MADHMKCSGCRYVVVVAMITMSSPAFAVDTGCGCVQDRVTPPMPGAGFFGADSMAGVSGHNRPAAGAMGSFGYKPLVIVNKDGSERSVVLRTQFLLAPSASMVFWNRLRLGVGIPLILYQQGDGGQLGELTYKRPSHGPLIGDTNLRADLRVGGRRHDPLQLTVGLQMQMPTGSTENYTGSGITKVGPDLNIAGEFSGFVYAAHASPSFEVSPFKSALLNFGFALGYSVTEKNALAVELFGSTVTRQTETIFRADATPVEALFALHHTGEKASFHLGAGPGSGASGSPVFRVVFGVDWSTPIEKPTPPILDSDHDGVPDSSDACPNEPGVAQISKNTNGCPLPPPDQDGDGVADSEDQCPGVPGPKEESNPKQGCPLDSDNDGIYDVDDSCPLQAGPTNENVAQNGCPQVTASDTDGDGIIDTEDACPNEKGLPDSDSKKNGCPIVKVVGNQIKTTKQVKFVRNKADLADENDPVLVAVFLELKKIPGATLLVHGHTDNTGSATFNQRLSQLRAESITAWMRRRGISKTRLSAEGFGSERPISDNDTETGRANNRRVEFILVRPDTVEAKP